jgi:endonuclease/exonuclease/phosphatase family metal-dependent hydrolase
MTAQRVPKGTPLRMGGLSVLSYNLLAPLYVRPIDQRTGCVQSFAAFEWSDSRSLDWDARRPALLRELVGSSADLICLQEVQFEKSANGAFALPEWLRLPGYEVRIPPPAKLQEIASRNLRVLSTEAAVGNVLLWRADRLAEAPPLLGAAPRQAGKAGKAKAARAGSSGRDQSVQRVGCVLRGVAGGGLEDLLPLAVFSVHLDATSEEKRLKQLSGCLEIAKEAGTRSVLIAGDMNTPMGRGSAVRALAADEGEATDEEIAAECAAALRLDPAGQEGGGEEGAAGGQAGGQSRVSADSDGDGGAAGALNGVSPIVAAAPSASQLEAWLMLRASAVRVREETRVGLARVPTQGTRAAWGVTGSPCVAWALDHILFTPSALQLDYYWETLESDEASVYSGMPNDRCPSDHLPVAACFTPLPPQQLSAAAAAALSARVAELESAQQKAWQALRVEMEAKRAEAEAEAGPVAPRGRPPESLVAHIRLRREAERALRAEMRQQRQALVGGMSVLELDHAEDILMAEVGGAIGWCEQAGR